MAQQMIFLQSNAFIRFIYIHTHTRILIHAQAFIAQVYGAHETVVVNPLDGLQNQLDAFAIFMSLIWNKLCSFVSVRAALPKRKNPQLTDGF